MTTAGPVQVEVPYVELRETGEWVSPVREAWGLRGSRPLTPELEERLSFTAIATSSYEKAARVAEKWGSPVADDSTIWSHAQRAGAVARTEEARRVRESAIPAVREQTSRNADCADSCLLIMMDGWMVRERGGDWGLKPSGAKGERVAWHEMKTAIVLRTEHRAATQSGRPLVLDKGVVCHQGHWDGLAPKVHAEALRRGLLTAREVFVVADGGLWIWNLAAERFPHATGVLDFYHASQHLWAMAGALFGEGSDEARRWAEPLLHQLRHGGERGALETIADLGDMLATLQSERRETVERGQEYFDIHRERMHYAAVAERGCPAGSGAMESTCAQLQGRFKRTGQFWTKEGKENLLALELADRNGDWQRLWPKEPEQG